MITDSTAIQPFSTSRSPIAKKTASSQIHALPISIFKRIYSSLAKIDQDRLQGVCRAWKNYVKEIRQPSDRSFQELPNELIGSIYSKLPTGECKNFRLVCKGFKESANLAQKQISIGSFYSSGEISTIFPQLNQLTVRNCISANSENFTDLEQLPHLQLLSLRNTKILPQMKLIALVNLKLKACSELSDSSLISFKELHSLKTLVLSDCPKIIGSGFVNLAELPELEALSISNCGASSDEGLSHISSLTRLRFVMLSESKALDSTCRITSLGLSHLRQLKDLIALKLKLCRGLTSGTIKQLAHLKGLHMLSLLGCNKLSERELKAAVALKSAAILDLSHCKVTKTVLEFKKRVNPNSYLEITGCQINFNELKNSNNIFSANNRDLQRISTISHFLNLHFSGFATYIEAFLERTKNFENPKVDRDRDLELFQYKKTHAMLMACHCILQSDKIEVPKPSQPQESPNFAERILRAANWALRQLNRLIMTALQFMRF